MTFVETLPPAPSRAVSLVIAVVVVIVWAIVRLVIFETTMFPLTYVLPLLICIWSRDRVALWGMAAVFAALHLTKLFVILPDRALAPDELWSNAIATLANLVIGAFAVDAIIRLRWRLEAALTDVHTQAEELRQQSEELAQQNEELTEQAEELSRQTTELSDQGEELADQNEELQSQSEEIHALNAALEQRERLLDTLLEATRSAGSEQMALRHIVRAAPGLFGDVCAAAAIYEQTSSGLRLWALATDASEDDDGAETAILEDAFALLILDQNRTAALNDTSRRPDLSVPVLPGRVPIRAVLGAPVRVAERPAGVFAIYCTREHDWSDEQFRLAEWIEASKPDVESAGHTLSVALPAEPLWIEADEDRIAQVVTNLLTNAARYTPPGGRITVSVAHSGHEAVLSVTDTGAGLHPDDVDRVFDMFTQVGGPGSGGLGIGLAIVRGIAELHGGRAEVRSVGLGRGSEFRVALPLNTLPHHDDNTIARRLGPCTPVPGECWSWTTTPTPRR